ncbi:hypothetical protein JXJ21_23100 [candidate division KSB1 bacterium]|nr:hypothetical protein [candidate division KSB1 bacterium]
MLKRNTWRTICGWLCAVISFSSAHPSPKMLCYSARPNAYFNDHAQQIAKIYDGFYFTIGSWDTGVRHFIGINDSLPEDNQWQKLARENIAALKEAGVTENFLTVHFGSNDAWPSAETLLSEDYTAKMIAHFSAIGNAAKNLGFRGVCIDTEYPYPRYEVNHEIYTYDNYTAEDLINAAQIQGKAIMTAILDQFPEAVIMNLPGVLRTRSIERTFLLGFLDVMAERQAPGGFHLGTEYTYCMHDPVTVLATSRFEDTGIELLPDEKSVAYWRKTCTIAPGVWPLHLVETGGKNYPIQAWQDEIKELQQEMMILRAATKRYIWSYSGNPVWYLHTDKLEKKYGLKKPNLKQADIDINDWHSVLKNKISLTDPGLLRLREKIEQFDRGELSAEQLCDAFGTPGRWWVLGMFTNPHLQPEFAASGSNLSAIDLKMPHFGRGNVVRWFAFDNLDPRGVTSLRCIFDWFHTDSASAQLVSFIHSEADHEALLHIGWDDGIIVCLDDEIVFDERDYPKRGKGMLFRDRYQFEKQVPISIKKGRTRLSVVSLNSHGNWVLSLRITDKSDLPFPDIRFRLN